jgi:hypothetical protein
LNLEFVKTNGLGPAGPTGPTGLPGSVKPTRVGSGSVNQPSPASSRSSLSPRVHWRHGIAAATAAWPLWPTLVGFAVTTLGKILSFAPSSISTKQNHRPPPLRGDLGDLSSWDPPSLSFPDAVPRCAGAC